jgi:hypothetical protein
MNVVRETDHFLDTVKNYMKVCEVKNSSSLLSLSKMKMVTVSE